MATDSEKIVTAVANAKKMGEQVATAVIEQARDVEQVVLMASSAATSESQVREGIASLVENTGSCGGWLQTLTGVRVGLRETVSQAVELVGGIAETAGVVAGVMPTLEQTGLQINGDKVRLAEMEDIINGLNHSHAVSLENLETLTPGSVLGMMTGQVQEAGTQLEAVKTRLNQVHQQVTSAKKKAGEILGLGEVPPLHVIR